MSRSGLPRCRYAEMERWHIRVVLEQVGLKIQGERGAGPFDAAEPDAEVGDTEGVRGRGAFGKEVVSGGEYRNALTRYPQSRIDPGGYPNVLEHR